MAITTARAVREAIRNFNPDALLALSRFEALAFREVAPETLSVVARRLAMLLGGNAESLELFGEHRLSELPKAKLRALPNWPKSKLFSEAERACLEYAEQYAIDVTGMTDAQAAELMKHYSVDQIFALAHAVYLIDAALRTQAVLGKVLTAY